MSRLRDLDDRAGVPDHHPGPGIEIVHRLADRLKQVILGAQAADVTRQRQNSDQHVLVLIRAAKARLECFPPIIYVCLYFRLVAGRVPHQFQPGVLVGQILRLHLIKRRNGGRRQPINNVVILFPGVVHRPNGLAQGIPPRENFPPQVLHVM
jgi:hypothetical protein